MNNTYFNKDIFPQSNYDKPVVPVNNVIGNYSVLPMEESYIENLLRKNIGKKVCIYLTFPNSNDYRDIKFNGILEQSGKDFVVLSEPSSGKWHLFPIIYINFITFDENINYSLGN